MITDRDVMSRAMTPQAAAPQSLASHDGDLSARPAAPTPTPLQALVHEALERPRLTVTRMADELGVPRATLEAYRLGTRRMPAATRVRLAAYLADHAEVLRRLAIALGAAGGTHAPTEDAAPASENGR